MYYTLKFENKFPEYIMGHYLEHVNLRDEHDLLWKKALKLYINEYYEEIDSFWFQNKLMYPTNKWNSNPQKLLLKLK